MKRLLIASENFLPRWDGVARFLTEIIPLLKDEFEITVLAPAFEGEFKMVEGAKIVRIPLMGINTGDLPLSKIDYRTIKKEVKETDIVWVHGLGPIGALATIAASKMQKPIVPYIHSIDWELYFRVMRFFKWPAKMFGKHMVKWLHNKATLIMVPTREVGEKYNSIKVKPKKYVVHLGVDTEKFSPAISKEEAKIKLGIDPNKKVIGYTGRLGWEKGVDILYNAFKRVKREKKDVILLIVGDGIKEIKKILASDRDVITPGSVSDVIPYLQAMDIYVLPSFTETSSLSTMEAMSCGLPVITTRVGYPKVYVKENSNGMFFPTGNATVLNMKLKNLLNSQEEMNRLGRNARETIIKHHLWSDTVKKVKHILNLF